MYADCPLTPPGPQRTVASKISTTELVETQREANQNIFIEKTQKPGESMPEEDRGTKSATDAGVQRCYGEEFNLCVKANAAV
jgi:hypothetical protein